MANTTVTTGRRFKDFPTANVANVESHLANTYVLLQDDLPGPGGVTGNDYRISLSDLITIVTANT